MKTKTLPDEILRAAVALLSPYAPDLTPYRVAEAIRAACKPGSEPPEKAGECVTVAEAAQRLRVSRRTAWRMVRDGTLKTVRLGPKTVRVSESELRRLAG